MRLHRTTDNYDGTEGRRPDGSTYKANDGTMSVEIEGRRGDKLTLKISKADWTTRAQNDVIADRLLQLLLEAIKVNQALERSVVIVRGQSAGKTQIVPTTPRTEKEAVKIVRSPAALAKEREEAKKLKEPEGSPDDPN